MNVRIFIQGAKAKEASVTRRMHAVPDVGDTIFIMSGGAPGHAQQMRVEVLERLWRIYPDRGVFAAETSVDLLVRQVPQ